MKSLGTRAKARREELNMSQADVARRACISQSTVAQIETGRNRGSKYIVQLAAALGTSILWLAEGRERENDLPSTSTTNEVDTGPLHYDVMRATLLSAQHRRVIEQILSLLINSMSKMPESIPNNPQLLAKQQSEPEPIHGKFTLKHRKQLPDKKMG